MTPASIEACASEPIRIPGAIQPFGALLVLDAQTHACLQRSRNFTDLVGADPAQGLSACPELAALLDDVRRWQAGDANLFICRTSVGERQFQVTGHKGPQVWCSSSSRRRARRRT
jgi:two-component system, chemotaxis family, sensor kinase Cph1